MNGQVECEPHDRIVEREAAGFRRRFLEQEYVGIAGLHPARRCERSKESL